MVSALDFDLKELPQPGQITLTVGGLSAGMEWGSIAILTEGSSPLMGGGKKAGRSPKKQKASNRQKLQSFTDLSPGDLVVHEQHGIGRFVEMTTMKMDGAEKDYIKIAYAGADTLYVPATQLDLISKYIGCRRGQLRAHPAEQAGRHRLGQGQGQDEKGHEGAGQGAHSALRPAPAPARLRLPRRRPVAAGV